MINVDLNTHASMDSIQTTRNPLGTNVVAEMKNLIIQAIFFLI